MSNRSLFFTLLVILPGAVFAQGEMDDVTIEAIPVADDIWMLQGRGGNIGLSAGSEHSFLVDDQYAPLTDRIEAKVEEVGGGPVRFVLNTHWHGDHVGGNEVLGEAGAVIVAHDNVRERMSAEHFSAIFDRTIPPSPEGALPVVTFNDQVTLHLNGEPIAVYHLRHAHTDGDSIVHFPGSNVIHMGDVWFNGLYPFIDRESGGSLQGTLAAVKFGLTLCEAGTKVIPGHGPLGDCAGLEAYGEMLADARDNVLTLMDQGMSLEEVIAAEPTAATDEVLGGRFIKPDQFVTFIYRSIESPPLAVGRP